MEGLQNCVGFTITSDDDDDDDECSLTGKVAYTSKSAVAAPSGKDVFKISNRGRRCCFPSFAVSLLASIC